MHAALHKNITLKAKPFLQKHDIEFDLSNYQNDAILKAGGYKFWYDRDMECFDTNEPRYKGKGFLDINELLAYALDIKEAKQAYRDAFGLKAFLKRSEPNKSVVTEEVETEEVIEENELSLAKQSLALEEINKKLKEKGWEINPYMNDRTESGRGLKPNELYVSERNSARTFILDVNTGEIRLREPINISRDKELMALFKQARHLVQKDDGNGQYYRPANKNPVTSKELEMSRKYRKEDDSHPIYDIIDARKKSNERVNRRDTSYVRRHQNLKENYFPY